VQVKRADTPGPAHCVPPSQQPVILLQYDHGTQANERQNLFSRFLADIRELFQISSTGWFSL